MITQQDVATLFQGPHIRFEGTHTDVFTLTLMKGDHVLFGPAVVAKSAFRDNRTRNLLLFSCGASPTKFGESFANGKEIGYNLVVVDEKVARDWFQGMAEEA
jgi:hypothetical protein